MKEIDPISNTNFGHCERSFSEYTLRICRAIVATNAIRLVQIHARPTIT